MSYASRLQKALEGAHRLPLNDCTKYVIFSDCHRGAGASNDNFLKNQTLFQAALKHYFREGYTYIELGDGDELWENRNMQQIIAAHGGIFELLSLFHRQNRLYVLYGNHDMIKRSSRYTSRHCTTYPGCCGNHPHLCGQKLLPSLRVHEGMLLQPSSPQGGKQIFLTHGHQADLLNSSLWRLSRFLVRYVWKPLEHLGIPDPTSAAKNYHRKARTEKRLHTFAKQQNLLLIAGHTHRPLLSQEELYYCNTGSCVHPYSITCMEIHRMHISLIKWTLAAGSDMRLYVSREVMSGPISLT